MTAGPDTLELLRRWQRRSRGMLLLWSGVVTLAAASIWGASRLGWWPGANLIAPLLVAAALVASWLVRAPRLTPLGLAQKLDAHWGLRGRMESLQELAHDRSAWAEAQRVDAAAAIGNRRLPWRHAWLAGKAMLALVAGLLLVEAATLSWRAGRREKTVAAAAAQKAAATEAPTTPQITIEWKAPPPEIQATAIEEVPLTASIETSLPLETLRLELTVNGTEKEATRPVEVPAAARQGKPGTVEVMPSLYLDELDLKPYDVVGYRLVAESAGPAGRVVGRSVPQLVQIRPTRRDASTTGTGSEFPARLMELKGRQLSLMKQNAALRQLAAARTQDESWDAENRRVATEQTGLAAKAQELTDWVRAHHSEAAVEATLGEAKGAMMDAGRQIAATENGPAERTQGRALALLVRLEQLIQRTLSSTVPPASNPIPDAQRFQLPQRADTPAGALEQLAFRADELTTRFESASGGGSPAGAMAGEFTAVAQTANDLATSGTYEPEIAAQITKAAQAAKEAANQLQAGDAASARVPAAGSRRALDAAVEAQNKAGRAVAVAVLQQVRRVANDATRHPGAGNQARQQIREELRTAAMQQQQSGSREAAGMLAELANRLEPSAGGARGGGDGGALDAFAGLATQTQMLLSDPSTATSRVIRQLRRAEKGPAGTDGAAELELAGQEAQWLTPNRQIIQSAEALTASADQFQRGKTETWSGLAEQAAKLATTLEQGSPNEQERAVVRRFSPSDIDPAYRAAVETYFERLSREAVRKASATTAPSR